MIQGLWAVFWRQRSQFYGGIWDWCGLVHDSPPGIWQPCAYQLPSLSPPYHSTVHSGSGSDSRSVLGSRRVRKQQTRWNPATHTHWLFG
ncbi:hypothetical protein Pmani_025630 [Petrolisthes manimaculis]|uniref:Uncharacterized protein n=1 Tax=Petrolisthes manimaculis TaxID=1843537 RepID=A0AAE1TXH3_9EUCA|nr:hypothetical protein Pmani_025630 [Petrolisthes manimaculis]